MAPSSEAAILALTSSAAAAIALQVTAKCVASTLGRRLPAPRSCAPRLSHHPASWLTPTCLTTRLSVPARCTGAGDDIAACSQLTITTIEPVDFVVSAETPSVPLAGDVITCAQGTTEITQGQYAYCCKSSNSFGPPKETGGLEACTTNNKPLTCLVSRSTLLLIKKGRFREYACWL
jgi:hypothetical protein